MPGRFVKKQPVALNPTIQGEQQLESHKIGVFAGYVDFFWGEGSQNLLQTPMKRLQVPVEQGAPFPSRGPDPFACANFWGCSEKRNNKKHQSWSLFIVTTCFWLMGQVGATSRNQETSAPSLTPPPTSCLVLDKSLHFFASLSPPSSLCWLQKSPVLGELLCLSSTKYNWGSYFHLMPFVPWWELILN